MFSKDRVRRQGPRPWHALLGLLLLFLAGRSDADRIGVFFDEQATVCTSTIEPFTSAVRVYVVAFPDSADLLAGVILKVEFSGELRLEGDLVFPRRVPEVRTETEGDLTRGLIVKYLPPCLPVTNGMVELFEFDVVHTGQSHVDNMSINVLGAGTVDSLTFLYPVTKLCTSSPEDPPIYVEAQPHGAHLNCTQRCICTVGVEPRTWTHVKKLFR